MMMGRRWLSEKRLGNSSMSAPTHRDRYESDCRSERPDFVCEKEGRRYGLELVKVMEILTIVGVESG
jgi:hypothetical protein